MSREHTRKNRDWHYSELENEVLGDVREGRAVIVFDLSNEGPAYSPIIFSELYEWIEASSLPAGRCIWLQQNRKVAESAMAHVGPRAELVTFAYYDYFVKVIAWMFAKDHPAPTLGVNPDVAIARLLDVKRKDKLLLCMNATPRLSRVLAVSALHHYGLIADSLVSFPGMSYVKQSTTIAEVLTFIDVNPALSCFRESVEAISQMSDLKIDNFIEQGNALVTKVDPTLYERSFFSLVTESDFTDDAISRVTEKTAKAFCMGHPSLIIGNTGSVKFMTDLGFIDWSDTLNRDAEANDSRVSRFQSVFSDVLRQVEHIRSNSNAWLATVRDVSAHNVRHAMSGAFLARCVETMDANLVNRLNVMLSE